MKTSKSKYIRLLERDGFVSEMNNTKWRRVIPILGQYAGRKRLKYIGYDSPESWNKAIWLVSKSYVDSAAGPQRLRLIEWVEVQTRSAKNFPISEDDVNHLKQQLIAARITPEDQDGVIRIYGHRKANTRGHQAPPNATDNPALRSSSQG